MPQSRPPASRKVRTIDVLIQGATVELFHFYGVAIAPVDAGEVREEARVHSAPTSTVNFHAPGFAGVLALSANPGVYRAMADLPPTLDGIDDWMREVANQLMGKVKSRIARFQISLHTELPQLRQPGDVERRTRSCKQQFAYSFRTLKGEVLVTLSGDFDEGSLVFSNASPLPLDGKVILF
ncbi:chemotaxis protein CheX [Sorangium sp. So ce131]|uniref:chemotaxis protein CheX n=1 Tax=Sorangium sp. So ce131 TaxID=3133282 RepID=UPI003F5D89BF